MFYTHTKQPQSGLMLKVCAAGGLLTYLQKLKASAAFNGNAGVELDGIESLSL